MSFFKKHFSLNEARQLLPVVKPLLQKIREDAIALEEMGFDLARGKYKPGFHPDTSVEFPAEYRRLSRNIRKVTDKGIQIKGLLHGLIDFPALRDNGEEVLLCWKLDEEDIEFWHGLDDGFRGRRHIDEF